jgi:hypothetical protein
MAHYASIWQPRRSIPRTVFAHLID